MPLRRTRRPLRRRGFALLVVIWGIGVITLLMVSFMTTARSRLQAAFNGAGATGAQLLADGALNLAILGLMSEQNVASPTAIAQADRAPHDGAPSFCSLAGAAVSIAIEDEEGKVDLNGASDKLLEAMLIGFGVGQHEAGTLARAIIDFREAPANAIGGGGASPAYSDRPFGPKRAPFQTALELDQVAGIEPDLSRLLQPVVTVYSRTPNIDPSVAPPALFAALAGYKLDAVHALVDHPDPRAVDRRDPRFPKDFAQPGAHSGAYLIHIEVAQPGGQTGVEEAIVRVGGAGVEPYAILELRHGRMRDKERLRAMAGRALPPC